MSQLSCATTIGKKAVMSDPLKPAGQDMQQEAANELIGIQAHHLLTRVVSVILPVKGQSGSARLHSLHSVALG